jgi:hypothetical protein
VTNRPRQTSFAPTLWAEHWASRPELRCVVVRLARVHPQGAWPDVAQYRRLLGADVDFVPASGRLPAGLDASDIADSYVDRCCRGEVPTRPENLHDFMNALTWAAFPLAKQTLCRRQRAVAEARGVRTSRVRTKAQDRLAMLDEGGVVQLASGETFVFGHGLLEDLVLGRASRGFPLPVRSCSDDDVATAIAALELPTEPEEG